MISPFDAKFLLSDIRFLAGPLDGACVELNDDEDIPATLAVVHRKRKHDYELCHYDDGRGGHLLRYVHRKICARKRSKRKGE
jgi:hypothetical protein